jgi:hypothetical protein
MGTFANIWHGVRREPENPRVGGSIPSQATKHSITLKTLDSRQ